MLKTMKKAVVPEVRMTEAARKRSAKIREAKEAQVEKPQSPKFRSRQVKAPSRNNTLEKKATNNSISNIVEAKKAKMNEAPKEREIPKTKISRAREPLKARTSTLNQKTTLGSRQNLSTNKKMSSITAAKVKEREEKQQMKDQIARLERDKIELSNRCKVLESKLASADILTTIVLPRIIMQRDGLLANQKLEQEKVANQLAEITTSYAQNSLILEQRLQAQSKLNEDLKNEISRLNGEIFQHIDDRNKLENAKSSLENKIQVQNSEAVALQERLYQVTKDNEKRIEEIVKIRIQPWTGAKAEADSLKVELEFKTERNQELQKRLNEATQNIEKVSHERDRLLNSLQKAESEEEKNRLLSLENRRLAEELENSRCALNRSQAEIQDLSFNLEEEKYRLSTGEKRANTSFRAVYDTSPQGSNSGSGCASPKSTDLSLNSTKFFSASDDVFNEA